MAGGAGGPPPGVAAVLAAPPVAPGPNAVPPPAFAFTATTADTLTQAQLGQLACFYNEGFGIVAGDDHATQLARFRQWLCGQ